MSPRTANGIVLVLGLLGTVAALYAIYDFGAVLIALRAGMDPVALDTGTCWLLFGSLLPLLLGVQVWGKGKDLKRVGQVGNAVLLTWLATCFALAILMPRYLVSTLTDAGYQECADPREVSRTAPGRSYLYTRGACAED